MSKLTRLRGVGIVLACIAALAFTSCTALYQNSIKINSSTTTSTSVKNVVRTSTASELETPAQIFVSKNESATDISVSWTAVENAASYRLERAIVDPTDVDANDPPEDDDFKVLRNQVFDTSYTDTVLSEPTYSSTPYLNGYKYYYRVTAENVAEGYEASEPTPNDVYGALLSPVSNVRATMGASTEDIGITWDATENASSYKIYRSRYADGSESSLVGSVASNLHEFTNPIDPLDQGKEFYYSIVAVTRNGGSSVSSSLGMGYALVEGAPSAPSFIIQESAMRATQNSFKVQWEAVATSGDTCYSIYYSTSKDSTVNQLAPKVTATEYTVTKGITPGVFYYYYVMAWYIDDDGNTIKGAMTTDNYECFLLSAPASVTAVKIPGATESHKITFPESIGNDTERAAYKYNIYGCDTQVGSYDLVLGDISGTPDASGNITALVTDARKFYYVTTSYNGKESKGSKVVAPAAYPPASINVSRNAVIENTTPTYTVAFADGGPNAKGVMPVKITWTKSSANDAYGYIVYRSKFNQKKQAYGSFTPITEVLPADQFSFIDTNPAAVQEEIYGYKVMATNILGQGASSSYTDAAWGYGALCVEQLMAQSSKTSKFAQRPPSQGGGLVSLNKADDNAKMTNGAWEYNYGQVSGQVAYDANLTSKGSVIGADVVMPYTNYADFFIYTPDGTLTTTIMDGECNTFAGADLMAGFVISGNLYGTMNLTGMYTGQIIYGNGKGDGYAKIGTKADGTSGVNGGGYYVTTSGYEKRWVDWTWGE